MSCHNNDNAEGSAAPLPTSEARMAFIDEFAQFFGNNRWFSDSHFHDIHHSPSFKD